MKTARTKFKTLNNLIMPIKTTNYSDSCSDNIWEARTTAAAYEFVTDKTVQRAKLGKPTFHPRVGGANRKSTRRKNKQTEKPSNNQV